MKKKISKAKNREAARLVAWGKSCKLTRTYEKSHFNYFFSVYYREIVDRSVDEDIPIHTEKLTKKHVKLYAAREYCFALNGEERDHKWSDLNQQNKQNNISRRNKHKRNEIVIIIRWKVEETFRFLSVINIRI